MLVFRGKSLVLKLMGIEQNLARQLLLCDRTILPEPTGGHRNGTKFMRASQPTIWLFSIGLPLCTVSYAEQKATTSMAEKAGREWAEQWLGDLRKRFAKPHEPVMHRANRGVHSFKPRMNLPFLNTPPITGPLSFTLALGTGLELQPNSTKFYPWLGDDTKNRDFKSLVCIVTFCFQGFNDAFRASVTLDSKGQYVKSEQISLRLKL